MDTVHKNVMICCPMRGLSDQEIEKNLWEIQRFIQDSHPEWHCSFFDNFVKYKTVINEADDYGLYCLGMGIANVMSRCDVIVFAPGHEASRGCLVEFSAAMNYNKEIIRLQTEDGELKIIDKLRWW